MRRRAAAGLGVIAVGALALMLSMWALALSRTPRIPPRHWTTSDTTELGVAGDLRGGPVFDRCSLIATYRPGINSSRWSWMNDIWPQEIEAELALISTEKLPQLSLVLKGSAQTTGGTPDDARWMATPDGRHTADPDPAHLVRYGNGGVGGEEHISITVPGEGWRYRVTFDFGLLTVGREGGVVRMHLSSFLRTNLIVRDRFRITADLPRLTGLPWREAYDKWGDPPCRSTVLTTRLRGPLMDSTRYRLDSSSDGYDAQRQEWTGGPLETNWWGGFRDELAPQVSVMDRQGEQDGTQWLFWAGVGFGAGVPLLPVGAQWIPWRQLPALPLRRGPSRKTSKASPNSTTP